MEFLDPLEAEKFTKQKCIKIDILMRVIEEFNKLKALRFPKYNFFLQIHINGKD